MSSGKRVTYNPTEVVKKLQYKATNYTDLLTRVGMSIGDLSHVENSQGRWWLPGTIGGNYYPKGWYIYNGTSWVSDSNDISQQLNEFTAYLEVNSDYTVTNNDYFINLISSSTLTLPTANRTPLKSFVIKNDSIGTTTINTFGTELIDGEPSVVLTSKGESITLKSTGSAWKIT